MLKYVSNIFAVLVTALLSVVVVMRAEHWAEGMKSTVGGEVLYYAVTMGAVWFSLMLVGSAVANLVLPKRPEETAVEAEDAAQNEDIVLQSEPNEDLSFLDAIEPVSASADPVAQLHLLNDEYRMAHDPEREAQILAEMSALASEHAEVFEFGSQEDKIA